MVWLLMLMLLVWVMLVFVQLFKGSNTPAPGELPNGVQTSGVMADAKKYDSECWKGFA